jgi:imidazole glycerol-phosphate synthase subunit HisH
VSPCSRTEDARTLPDRLVVVDYQAGNLASIPNMLRRLGSDSITSADPEVVAKADRLILPGVGAFDHGISQLESLGLEPALREAVERRGVPIAGICLGMQLLSRRSDEGERPGLGWIDAETIHFGAGLPSANGLRLPHIGWNYAYAVREHPLNEGLPNPSSFYFVHSYRVVCQQDEDILLGTRYSGVNFCSGFVLENICAFQFHPEKSHVYGLELLRRFLEWKP